MPQIEISGLRYTYPEHSFQVEIDRQSLTVHSTAIVGQNGAGKSTLLKLLIGLITPQEGTIMINGVSIDELKSQAKLKQIGVTFQDPDDQLFNATVQKKWLGGFQIESDQLMIKKRLIKLWLRLIS